MKFKIEDLASKRLVGTNTIMTLSALFFVFAALGAFLGYLISIAIPAFHWYIGSVIMFLVALIVLIMAVRKNKNHVNEIIRVIEESGEDPKLHEMVERLAGKAGIETPSVAVIHKEDPNACTTGNREKSYIIVNDALLNAINDEELEGVLAHEVSHIKNGDILTSQMASSLSHITTMFSKYLGVGLVFAGFAILKTCMKTVGSVAGAGIAGLIMLGLEILGMAVGIGMIFVGVVLCIFYPIAALLKMSLSRDREYMADKSAAYLTNNPMALAHAFEKLLNYKITDKKYDDSYNDLMFVNHLSSNLFDTHPPMEKRIERMMELDRRMREVGSFEGNTEELEKYNKTLFRHQLCLMTIGISVAIFTILPWFNSISAFSIIDEMSDSFGVEPLSALIALMSGIVTAVLGIVSILSENKIRVWGFGTFLSIVTFVFCIAAMIHGSDNYGFSAGAGMILTMILIVVEFICCRIMANTDQSF